MSLQFAAAVEDGFFVFEDNRVGFGVTVVVTNIQVDGLVRGDDLILRIVGESSGGFGCCVLDVHIFKFFFRSYVKHWTAFQQYRTRMAYKTFPRCERNPNHFRRWSLEDEEAWGPWKNKNIALSP